MKNLLPPSTPKRTWNYTKRWCYQILLIDHQVYFNGELESRRGKKIRVGDTIDIPDLKIDITLTKPSLKEQEEYQADKIEKERIAKLVKEMNKGVKKEKQKTSSSPKTKQVPRFPGR